jgi:hypothetical protein
MHSDQISEDEIIRDWTFSTLDKQLLYKLNKNNRIWAGVQLCALRLYGRLLENPNEILGQVISYICRQLDLAPTINICKPQRKATYIEHRHALSRWIFFANHGKFQVGDYEEIMNKASCLSLQMLYYYRIP